MIFANNRIAKLNKRAVYEINSNTIKKGISKNGAPAGKNKLKKFKPCIEKHMYTAEKKVIKESVSVTIK